VAAYEDAVPVLDGVDLALAPGEAVALVGVNGSGKTTLLRVLAGLAEPRAGRVLFDGADLATGDGRRSAREGIGVLFANPEATFVASTVEREIAFGLENRCWSRDAMRSRVDDLLAQFDLAARRCDSPLALSGGERARLALAAALAPRPRCLFVDEAFDLLDARHRGEARAAIAQARSADGLALLWATQEFDEAALADRVIALAGGRVALETPRARLADGAPALAALGLRASSLVLVRAELVRRGWALGQSVDPESIALAIDGAGSRAPEPDRARGATPAASDSAESSAAPRGARAADPIARLDAVGHVYDAGYPAARRALHAISLAVRPAERVALLGPSGSGKSTLAEILAGVLSPTEGRVEYAPVVRGAAAPVRLLFQFPEVQLFALTVLDDVAFGPRNAGLGDDGAVARAREALALCRVPEALHGRAPWSLSGGERRRVAFAGILALEPRLVVLDEPEVGLDREGRARLEEIVAELAAHGTAVVIATHDAELALRVADRALLLEEGRLAHDGGWSALLARPERFRAAGIEAPGTALLLDALGRRGWPVRRDRAGVLEVVEEIERAARTESSPGGGIDG